MTHMRRSIAVAACLAAALAGCGGPFFVSETDLRNVLGKEYLYAGSHLGIDAFEIDIETGGITKLAGSPFGAGCTNGLAAALGGAALYGIPVMYDFVHGYRVEQGGSLTDLWAYDPKVIDAANLYSPTAMAVSPDGRFAYISHSTTAGALSGYAVDQDTAALTYLGSTLGIGCAPVSPAIDATGSNLYIGTSVPMSIQHCRVSSGVPGTVSTAVTMSSPIRRLAVHPRGYLYAITSSISHQNIFAYQIDPVSGALTALSGSPFRLGFGCSNLGGMSLAIDHAGEWLYATANNYEMYSYRVDGATGGLTIAQGLGAMNGGNIAPSSTGRYVFVGGDHSGAIGQIRVYQVDDNGLLSEVPGSPFDQTSGAIMSLLAVNTFRLP